MFSIPKKQTYGMEAIDLQDQRITLTVEEMSKRMGIGINGAYSLVRSKGFPAFRYGKKILIPVKDLDEWLSKRSCKNGRRIALG